MWQPDPKTNLLILLNQDRVLCVPDDQHKKAIDLFNARNTILKPFRPSPMGGVGNLLRTFPRFKVVGQSDFWIIVTASFANIPCEPANIVKSIGGLPYPELSVYAQSLLDTQNGTDLEELIDGMDLSQEWGEENLDLDGSIDVEWTRRRKDAVQAFGGNPIFLGLSTAPKQRRSIWQASVLRKGARMGLKKPAAVYATRWRRHGSQDPTSIQRNLI